MDSPLVFWFSSRRQARLLDQELQRNITKAALRLGRAKDATQAAQARHGWGSSLGYLLGYVLRYLAVVSIPIVSATPKRGLDLQWSGLAMVFFNQKYEHICIKLKK